MIVCLDTNIVIYMIEPVAVWGPRATARVTALQTAGEEIALCDATRLECLIKPLAMGDTATEQSYRDLFVDPNVRMLPVSTATWERAALIGAKFNFKPMDNLHLATAIEHGCGLFVTADARLARCTDIVVEALRACEFIRQMNSVHAYTAFVTYCSTRDCNLSRWQLRMQT